MFAILFLIQLTYCLQTDIYSFLLKNSIEDVNKRYLDSNEKNLLDRFNRLSEEGAIRKRFYTYVLKTSKITKPEVIIEYSSSGEAFSFTGLSIGYDERGTLCRVDYTFYSNQEKTKVKRLKNKDKFWKEISVVKQSAYDEQNKIQFPSDLLVVSFLNNNKVWEFRVSETPTKEVEDIIMLLD